MGQAGKARPSAVTVTVVVIAALITAVFTWAAGAAHAENEDRLITQRTREAGAAVAAAVPTVELPLRSSAALADTVAAGDSEAFADAIGTLVGPDRQFISASVWSVSATAPLAVVGAMPAFSGFPTDRIQAFLNETAPADEFRVVDLLDQRRLGYGVPTPDKTAGLVVYAEQVLPSDPTIDDDPASPFAGLEYALYLGDQPRPDGLLFANTEDLPLSGRQATDTVMLGDQQLLLVMSPTGDLSGGLLAALPWLIGITGGVLSMTGGALAEVLHRRQRRAETLAAEIALLYADQRKTAERLQRSLLPRSLPDFPDVELGIRYFTGVSGTEIGGDWYDAFEINGRLIMIVGDVSGRGLGAASVMASLRFAARALAPSSKGPAALLRSLDALNSIERGEHFITMLCVEFDAARKRVRVANAGHPPLLLVHDGDARFVDAPVGPPIGVTGGASYEEVVAKVAPATTMVMVTDGLIERRGETVDVGLERLRALALQTPGPLDAFLDAVARKLGAAAAADDAAILAARWAP